MPPPAVYNPSKFTPLPPPPSVGILAAHGMAQVSLSVGFGEPLIVGLASIFGLKAMAQAHALESGNTNR